MSNTQQYKPGDEVNGHILTEAGQWVPVYGPGGMQVQPTPPVKKKGLGKGAKIGIVAGSILVLMVGCGIASGGGDDTPTAQPVVTVTETPTPEPSTSAPAPAAPAPAPAPKPAPKPKPKPKPAAPSVLRVSAKTILGEFDDNEAAADLKYKGKRIAVTGIVDKVDTEFLDDSQYVVKVGPGGDWVLWTVDCDDQTASVASKIKKGQSVTVTGDFEDGGDLGVDISGCVVS